MPVRKISLEEAFNTKTFSANEEAFLKTIDPAWGSYIGDRIFDLTELRIPDMDAAGIDMQILSLTSPGIQSMTDVDDAVRAAIDVNDMVAAVVEAHPTRFAAMASLPCQSPTDAANELDRAVTQLGFVGAMINGHTNGAYLDDPAFRVLWEKVAELDVPVYIHPIDPPSPWSTTKDYPELDGAAWGWAFETGTHALRLVLSGLFDELPDLKVLVGHMGEFLPFSLWRLDDRLALVKSVRALEHAPSYYVKKNIYVTTSGVNSYEPLQCTQLVMGADHVLFAVDYPYQYQKDAADFIEAAPMSDDDRALICHGNAERLFRL